MNERIRELAEQADNFADEKTQMPGEYHPDWHDIRDEKFAELIIKKCISEIAQIGISNFKNADIMWTVETAIANIEEQFGVEE